MHIIFDYEKDMKFRPLACDGEISDEELEDWKLSYPKKSRSLKK